MAAYRPAEAISHLRPSLALPRIPARRFTTSRAAFSSPIPPPPPPPRRSITLAGDTGRVRWNELSPGEKVVRTTQQSFNLVVVTVGVVATGAVAYVLFSDVLSPESKVAYFNRATDMVRSDARCQQLLGEGAQIAAFGEGSAARFARNNFFHSESETDRWGTEHLRFRFYVEGPKGQGVVHVHLTKKPSQGAFDFASLAVDVKGHQRIDLVNGEKSGRLGPKIFGARWW